MGDTRRCDERAYYFAYCLSMDAARLRSSRVVFLSSEIATLPDYSLSFNVLEDHEFVFERRGLANVVPQTGRWVEGVLYEAPIESVHALDDYIGVEELKYYRKPVRVHRQSGCVVTAFTYAAWPDKTAEGLLPHDRYLTKLIQAAKGQGCSPQFVSWLSNQPTCV